MRKKLIFLILMTGFQISAATSDVAGEYELITGKVGIYRMHTMIITKNSSNKLYTVRFLGDERNLTYDDAQLRGKTLRISDRGMPIIIKIENDRAILDSDSARFRRRQLISSKFNMTKKSYKQGLTNYSDFSEGSRVGITVEGIGALGTWTQIGENQLQVTWDKPLKIDQADKHPSRIHKFTFISETEGEPPTCFLIGTVTVDKATTLCREGWGFLIETPVDESK